MEESMFCHTIEFGTPEFDDALRLRYEVLRKPLGLDFTPEEISMEYDNFHLSCFESETGELLATLQFKVTGDTTLKMRQVAVMPSRQMRGAGRCLVVYSEQFARERGFHRIELQARQSAISFYEKLGYKPAGDAFEEVGIPHRFMFKDL